MTTFDKISSLLAKISHKRQVSFALYCAKDRIDLIDKNNKAAFLALKLTEKWLKDSSSVSNKELRGAANSAAYSAAYSAANNAAYNAANAAYSAANSAAYAANAAYNAAYAANAAYNAAYNAANAANAAYSAANAAYNAANAANAAYNAANNAAREKTLKKYLDYLLNTMSRLEQALYEENL